MIDETELFYKIENKQLELDYNNHIIDGIEEYNKTKCKIEALEWVKRLIAEESDEDFILDHTIELGKEWN